MNSTVEHEDAVVYRTIRTLPDHERPVYIYRKDGKTIIAVDPRSTRMEVVVALVEGLSDDEGNALRDGFGLPHRHEGSLPPNFVSDEPTLFYVPLALRLPDEPAIQGDEVLDARVANGDLPLEELAMLADEPPSLERNRELSMWGQISRTTLSSRRGAPSQVG